MKDLKKIFRLKALPFILLTLATGSAAADTSDMTEAQKCTIDKIEQLLTAKDNSFYEKENMDVTDLGEKARVMLKPREGDDGETQIYIIGQDGQITDILFGHNGTLVNQANTVPGSNRYLEEIPCP